jgi:hypothetical protein
MIEQRAAAVAVIHASHPHTLPPPPTRTHRLSAIAEERLPFTVRLVCNQDDLRKAVHIRHSAYARHLPTFAETLLFPETADSDAGVVVLLAESKLDGSPLGTMRIQTNRVKPLTIEQSIPLPPWLQRRPLIEATRLGVTDEKAGRLVKTVLFKACFLYCLRLGIESIVIAARSPMDKQYYRLSYKDVYPDTGYIPLRHAGNIPHRIMSFDVFGAEELWATEQHPLFDFTFRTRHPDIDIGCGAMSDFTKIADSESRKLAVDVGVGLEANCFSAVEKVILLA